MTPNSIILVIIAIVVIAGLFYFMNQQNNRQQQAVIQPSQTTFEPCIPYTQKQYDDALRILRNKCAPQLLIPVVGIGAYNTCMVKGKANLQEVKIC